MTSISYEDALRSVLEVAEQVRQGLTLSSEAVATEDALGRYSTEDVFTSGYLPAFDNSAMDGFAVCSSSTRSASKEHPVRMHVLGSVAAGDPPPTFQGSLDACGSHTPLCYRINTGAPFPIHDAETADAHQEGRHRLLEDGLDGKNGFPLLCFDACARVEIVNILDDQRIEVMEPIKRNQHRRRAGEDFRPRQRLLSRGQRIRSGNIAALCANGISTLNVQRNLRIAILNTGKELQQVQHAPASSHHRKPDQLRLGQIYNTNGPYISAALREAGFPDVHNLMSVGDEPSQFQEAISKRVLGDYDVLITTGGVSKGEHDYVKESLKAIGASVRFHGVRIRPGHPILFATLPVDSRSGLHSDSSQRPLTIFSLPGNPVAAAACLRFFTVPFLDCTTSRIPEPSFAATLSLSYRDEPGTASLKSRTPSCHDSVAQSGQAGTTRFLLGTIRAQAVEQGETPQVTLLAKGSGMLRPLSEADCWVVLPEGQSETTEEAVVCYSI